MPCQLLDSAKKLKNVLNQALAEYDGVFWEDIKDAPLQALIKTMTREYFINGGKTKNAVTAVGRQGSIKPGQRREPEDDMCVFNKSVQVSIQFIKKAN